MKANESNQSVAAYMLTWGDETILIVHNVGTSRVKFDASAFDNYGIVGSLHASGGKVGFANGDMTLDGGTVLLLKPTAE